MGTGLNDNGAPILTPGIAARARPVLLAGLAAIGPACSSISRGRAISWRGMVTPSWSGWAGISRPRRARRATIGWSRPRWPSWSSSAAPGSAWPAPVC
jgi:hypothetical protein